MKVNMDSTWKIVPQVASKTSRTFEDSNWKNRLSASTLGDAISNQGGPGIISFQPFIFRDEHFGKQQTEFFPVSIMKKCNILIWNVWFSTILHK